MSDDASRALGMPELAGTFVNPRGLTKRMTASVAGSQIGGVVGGTAAGLIANRSAARAAGEMPSFGRVGYLAVSEQDVALVRTKAGAFKMKVSDEVLARVPRGDVSSAELDQGRLLSRLKLSFSNGVVWEFDIPKQAKKTAQGVTHALGGALS